MSGYPDRLAPGSPYPLGATWDGLGINFAVFSAHADAYQAVRAQIADFHQQFVQTISASGQAYATAEADNAQIMQTGALDLLG